MRFSTSFVFAALASLVAAQNPFTFTDLSSITAGQPFEITWSPSTGTVQTVTLILRQGDPNNLDTVTTIASGIENTGSFTWTPPTTLVNGDDYAFEIQNDLNTAIVNYSNQFAISSPNTVTPASTAASSTAASSSGSSASASASGSTSVSAATTTGSTTGTSTVTNGSTTSTGTSTGNSTGTSSTTVRTTTTRSSSTGTATESSAATVSSINGAGSIQVGTGMLALVGFVMAAL